MQYLPDILKRYLDYVENTESPVPMHVWSFLTCMAACLERNVFLDQRGLRPIYPNFYTILVGPPATKKNTAIDIATDLLLQACDVNCLANDTGGQRQGIIADMIGLEPEEVEEKRKKSKKQSIEDAFSAAINAEEFAQAVEIETRNACFFGTFTELTSFIGKQNLGLLTFLIEMWDGKNEYVYKLKREQMRIHRPLLSFIAGTTPKAIADSIPMEAANYGFLSRIIFVCADDVEKQVARPSLKKEMEGAFLEFFHHLHEERKGPIEESAEAADFFDSMYYARRPAINDPRFLYYNNRRHVHLKKLCILMALCSNAPCIEVEHIKQAHKLLAQTEKEMTYALSEYRGSEISTAKNFILDALRMTFEPLTNERLWNLVERNVDRRSYDQAVGELVSAGVIEQVEGRNHILYTLSFNISLDEKKDSATNLIPLDGGKHVKI